MEKNEFHSIQFHSIPLKLTGGLFWIFFLILVVTQISALVKDLTPYPKWCAVFSLPVGMILAMAFGIFGNHEWVNAITCAWIPVGNIWMFAGLLLMMKKAEN